MVVISTNRMAFGSHFLSDVLVGWGLMAVVVLACRRLILEDLSDDTIASVERGLAYLKRQGINALGDTIRSDGAVATSAYLDLSIGGFALHLVRA